MNDEMKYYALVTMDMMQSLLEYEASNIPGLSNSEFEVAKHIFVFFDLKKHYSSKC